MDRAAAPRPGRDETPAGSKYLNTPETELFVEGNELFGLAEARALLSRGPTPVLIEGPLDALPITAAEKGEFVAIAPLATAFTDRQAGKVHQITEAHRRVVVATNADTAGRKAAENMFWRLVDHGIEPTSLVLPPRRRPGRRAARRRARGAVGNL